MALFAPQVSATQPAFIYDITNKTGEVTISFSLSSYNKDSDFSVVRYTIVDPNVPSTWGTNSMILTGQNDSQNNISSYKEAGNLTGSNGEYSFKISFNATDYKIFTQNQFYQVQLWLVKGSEVSEASQVTLIRPIAAPNVYIAETSPLTHLRVYLNETSPKELIDYCSCKVYQGSELKDTIENIYSNGEGRECIIPLDPLIVVEGQTYTFKVTYTTIHGFQRTLNDKTISYSNLNGTGTSPKVTANTVKGSIFISAASGILERYSDEDPYWQEINNSFTGSYEDFAIASDVNYKYRIRSVSKSSAEIKVQFEDIFLSDEDTMFVVRYNPNISGFKYVVQDSITNTLGGRYPIIRSNGDTKYRQFNISGLIYADGLVDSQSDRNSYLSHQNLNEDVQAWFDNRENILYLSTGQNLTVRPVKLQVAEKLAKQKIIDFLTNRNPKLFRSFEEGNMIVYLSNISFTPNKTLGRHIYDFSATATEVCECNAKNLQKYHLNNNSYIPATVTLLAD